MEWNGIYGRSQLIRTLQAAITEEQTSHACLFYGPEGIGKRTVAQAYAAALNCCEPEAGSCGACLPCRKAAEGTHPDIHWILPDGKSLKIDQIRKIKRSAYLRPHEGRYQIFVLEDADLLTPEAANSLLKVLEEPPPAAKFILLAQNPSALPPTIVSRCLLFPLPRLDGPAMEKSLAAKGICPSAEETERIIRLAEGIPGKMLFLAAHGDWHHSYQETVELLLALLGGEDPGSHAARLAEKESMEHDLEIMLHVLRDLLMLQTTHDAQLVSDRTHAEKLAALVDKWPLFATMRAIEAVLKLHRDLQSPINARLALERALRRIKEDLTDADSCRDPL